MKYMGSFKFSHLMHSLKLKYLIFATLLFTLDQITNIHKTFKNDLQFLHYM